MAKNLNLKPGEYRAQVVYVTGETEYMGPVLKSLEAAQEYIHELEAFEFSDDWEGVRLIDSDGEFVKWW